MNEQKLIEELAIAVGKVQEQVFEDFAKSLDCHCHQCLERLEIMWNER